MPTKINAADLPPALRKQLGLRTPRKSGFTKDKVRSWALRALAPLSGLSQDQRRRVLEHATRLNHI